LLPADQNFSPLFAFLTKTHPKPPFGNPQAFQPPKWNNVIFLVIFVHIDSHSILFDAPSLIIESSHVSPAPSPLRFHRWPPLSSATVNIIIAATAVPAVTISTIIVAAVVLSLPPLPVDVAIAVTAAVTITATAVLASSWLLPSSSSSSPSQLPLPLLPSFLLLPLWVDYFLSPPPLLSPPLFSLSPSPWLSPLLLYLLSSSPITAVVIDATDIKTTAVAMAIVTAATVASAAAVVASVVAAAAAAAAARRSSCADQFVQTHLSSCLC
jgi:hypothetical protein